MARAMSMTVGKLHGASAGAALTCGQFQSSVDHAVAFVAALGGCGRRPVPLDRAGMHPWKTDVPEPEMLNLLTFPAAGADLPMPRLPLRISSASACP